jgi:bifunctional enzyme CysN/CysC
VPHRELLRFLSAGSVDDGKSTLIGRLLHDTNSIYQDQFAALRSDSPAAGGRGIDFSLVTDGLRAEREQGITIDVAYRYFSTPRRKFIVADAPGHEQYTRNMATAASTAQLAVLLLDARKGLLPQTCRHTVIAWLLGIRSFAVAVNKMDLVDFREEVFREIEQSYTQFLAKLGEAQIHAIPTCSLDGDNIVHRSGRTPWFTGQALLEHLETTPVTLATSHQPLRLPVQYVLRSGGELRRYAGQIASGVLHKGDAVVVLPSKRQTRITSLRSGDQELDSAAPPLSISVGIEDHADIGRGDMIVAPDSLPNVSARFPARLVWFSDQPMRLGQPCLIKHTTRNVCGSVVKLEAVVDPTTLKKEPANTLVKNEFGEVEIESHQPLYWDAYDQNRVTGAFIIIDPLSNETLAAGMMTPSSPKSVAPAEAVPSQGLTVWLTGLSSAGKTTLSLAVYEKLWARGYKVERLDGDIVRQHLSKDLGFSKEDRDENIRRIGFMARLLTRNGVIVLVSAISPYRSVREEIRQQTGSFLEVYVNASLETCEQRDRKGIYRRARAGELHGVTGVDDPYEPPLAPDVECRTDLETLAESTDRVLNAIDARLSLDRTSLT